MASKSVSVNYLAYNIGSLDNIKPLRQSIASIVSFNLSQIMEPETIKKDIKLSVTEDYVRWLATNNLTMVADHVYQVKYKHNIIPIIQCEGILESFERSSEDYVLTIDSDTVFLRPYIMDLLKSMEESGSDIAMVPECGSTGFKPYANFNCGLLVMRRNRRIHNLLKTWIALCETNKELAIHGNQRLFPHALAIAQPKIFPIDNVYNLRCHPVYGGISQVWSIVYMVHNHQVSNYWVEKVFKSIEEAGSNKSKMNSDFKIELAIIDSHFTPSQEPYKPRYVSSYLL